MALMAQAFPLPDQMRSREGTDALKTWFGPNT